MKIPFRWWWVPTFLSVLIAVFLGLAIKKITSMFYGWEGYFLVLLFCAAGGFMALLVLLALTWGFSGVAHDIWKKKRLRKERGGKRRALRPGSGRTRGGRGGNVRT